MGHGGHFADTDWVMVVFLLILIEWVMVVILLKKYCSKRKF